MKTAVVLAGGGAKGAYQLGVWKALRKLDIDFDIVVGTSIGALNGFMMASDNYSKCLNTWYMMNYDYVSSMEISGKYDTKRGRREIITKYTKGLLKGGYKMDGLSKVIDYAMDYEKFKSSKIDFGIAITNFPSFKGRYVTKKEMNEDNLKKYLLATASCFPAFRPTKIGKDYYIDGGYFDNIPFKLALDMGATNLIIIDLDAVGISKSIKKINVPYTLIKPKIKLGNLLVFESNYTQKYAKLGYNDALKTYGKLDGNKYSFKKESLNRNYLRNINRFLRVLNKYKVEIKAAEIKNLFSDDNEKYYNEILENLMDVFSVDPIKIYRSSLANVLVRNAFLKGDYEKYNSIKASAKLKSNGLSYELISFMYNAISNNKKVINKYINKYPRAFLCAIYLYSIINKR